MMIDGEFTFSLTSPIQASPHSGTTSNLIPRPCRATHRRPPGNRGSGRGHRISTDSSGSRALDRDQPENEGSFAFAAADRDDFFFSAFGAGSAAGSFAASFAGLAAFAGFLAGCCAAS